MKRTIDIAVGVVALVVLSPVLAITAIAVRWRLGSPVLFRQVRPGRGGKAFEMLKFRSMATGGGTDADRLSPFGVKLRASSLDELPELVNIVRGDMSIVGPRPLLEEYLPLYNARQARRHEVRPGLTGLSQVSGRNGLGWAERLELDVQYVETRSLLLDLRIIFRTIRHVVSRDGVTAEGEVTMGRFTGSDAET